MKQHILCERTYNMSFHKYANVAFRNLVVQKTKKKKRTLVPYKDENSFGWINNCEKPFNFSVMQSDVYLKPNHNMSSPEWVTAPCSPEINPFVPLSPQNQNLVFLYTLFPKNCIFTLFTPFLDFPSLVPLGEPHDLSAS